MTRKESTLSITSGITAQINLSIYTQLSVHSFDSGNLITEAPCLPIDLYGGWIVSKVQSVFWRRVTSLRRGVVSTGGGTFLLEDTSFCGGVRFDLEEGV